MTPIKNFLFLVCQFILPHHLLSRAVGTIARCRWYWLKSRLIRWFISVYKVDMSEAKLEKADEYDHFNDFFTRELKAGARTWPDQPGLLASPVDGAISQIGEIRDGRIFQAKGHDFSTRDLLGGSAERAAQFAGGQFATIYLAPRDYHRIHMPLSGKLLETTYIPGRLFSVSPLTTENISGLFARNERLVTLFDTEIGPVGIVLVGAMIVASIETTWSELSYPPGRRLLQQRFGEPVTLAQGDEMGRFKLGSTVILLFGKDTIEWNEELKADVSVRLGDPVAKFIR